ncbi:GNAT family N-acetyltransferase [Nocardioides luti]|uniref:GNAT family N-acetyltransferase n=1 Tax=Nocardioides luti TaxID=2761101 RepID=UPI0031B6059E
MSTPVSPSASPSVVVLGFDGLDVATAYDVWQLRQAVFVVEQACPYPDLDGRDREPGTRHVLLREAGALVGYARVLDDGGVGEWRIGRVVLAPAARGRGLATPLMEAALAACPAGRDVVLDAQAPLAGFYGGFGFVVDGAEFLEDGIPHVPMRLSGRAVSPGTR